MRCNLYKFIILFLLFVFCLPFFSSASTIDDLKAQIKNREAEIKELEAQAAKYKTDLNVTKKQSNTLKYQITKMEEEILEMNLNIKKTQNKIFSTTVRIEELKDQIAFKETEIIDKRKKLGYAIQMMNEWDSRGSLLSLILDANSFSDLFNQQKYLDNLQAQVKNNLDILKNFKEELGNFKQQKEDENVELKKLGENLKDQRGIAEDQKQDKDSLLKDTKNKEKEYQKLLADVNSKMKDIEKEVNSLETKLRQAIDRSKLPKGKGVLKWPVAEDVNLSQGYGKPNWNAAYDFHNGIDIRGYLGRPILAAADGKVIGVGNSGKYSFGKWIVIDHGGLNIMTLYGHLSSQKVSVGKTVKAGDVIGLMGSTGYSTGVHLHFTVFASDSYSLIESTKIKNLWIPIGGSINPLELL